MNRQSYNVLYIKSLSSQVEKAEFTMSILAELTVQLQFKSPLNGRTLAHFEQTFKAKANSDKEAFNKCIQNFLDLQKYDPEYIIDSKNWDCDIHYGIDSFEYMHLGMPWIMIFDQIFSFGGNIGDKIEFKQKD